MIDYKQVNYELNKLIKELDNVNGQVNNYLNLVMDSITGPKAQQVSALILKGIIANPESQIYKKYIIVEQAERQYEYLKAQSNVQPELIKKVLSERDKALEDMSTMLVKELDSDINKYIKKEMVATYGSNVDLEVEIDKVNEKATNTLKQLGFKNFEVILEAKTFELTTESVFDAKGTGYEKEQKYDSYNIVKNDIAQKYDVYGYNVPELVNSYALILQNIGRNNVAKKDLQTVNFDGFKGNQFYGVFKNHLYLYDANRNKTNRDNTFNYVSKSLNVHELSTLNKVTGYSVNDDMKK